MTKRKDGLWQHEYKLNGKRKFVYGKTQREVAQKLAVIEELQGKGRTFEEVADEWWEEASENLAPNSLKNYTPAYKRAVEMFKDTRIREIVPLDISRQIKAFSKKKADKTVRTQLMIINLIMKHAVDAGDINLNPARDVTIPKGLDKKKVSVPSDVCLQRVKESVDHPFGLFAFMALYTGLRRGELLALRWEDFDLKNRKLIVSKSMYFENGESKIKKPKTNAGIRYVPILDKLVPYIKKSGIVFERKDGEYYTNGSFEKAWERYCKDTGVDCTPHQLRHAFATMLYEQNISDKDIQYVLGHAQLSTTMDIYTDIRSQRISHINKAILAADL
jgi:integrase